MDSASIAIVERYLQRGFPLVYYPHKQKGPSGPAAVGWPSKATRTISGYKGDENVGVLLGTEIEPGKFLVDVDFDWQEGVVLARSLLPTTGFFFGRGDRPITHAFFTTDTPAVSRKFEDIDGQVLVELRGTKTDGSIGLQTMLPPSVHPCGDVVTLRADDDIEHAPHVERQVAMYATACLLFRRLGAKGFGHDVRLAVVGLLHKTVGLEKNELTALCGALAEATGNDKTDVDLVVKTTLARVKKGERIAGRSALVKALGDDGKRLVVKILEWFGVGDFYKDDKDRIIRDDQRNVALALQRLNVTLCFDEFAERMLIERPGRGKRLFDDKQLHRLWLEMERSFGFRPSLEYLNIVLEDVALDNAFHPVRDYLDALTWDGTPRLDTWMIDYANAEDTPYVRAVSKLLLIAAVSRVRRPGVKFDELVVLESEQGNLKSSALKALCRDEDWFSDDLPLNVDAKQIIERTAGKWIIEVGELAGMKKSEVESLKGTLSRGTDGPVRLAYEKTPTERPRHFVIVGTTNSDDYLKDTTGNRRFWPVRVRKFDVEGLRVVRDQLWAEAAHRQASGASIRLDESLWSAAAKAQEERRITDPWEDQVRTVLPDEGTGDWPAKVTADDVWASLAVSVDRRTQDAGQRLNAVMKTLGYKRQTIRHPATNKPVWGFQRICRKKAEDGQGELIE